jgi:hypothetical protein
MNAVVARVDDQLDAVLPKEIAHGGVAILHGGEASLRQLADWDSLVTGKNGRAA